MYNNFTGSCDILIILNSLVAEGCPQLALNLSKYWSKKVIKFKNYGSLNIKLKKLRVDTIIHCATHYVKNHEFSDINKFCVSNVLFGNIILENLKNLGAKKFINFSTVWEDSNAKKDNVENSYAAYKKSFSTIISYYKKNSERLNFMN